MKERFEGTNGRPLLCAALKEQTIVNGSEAVAFELAQASQMLELKKDEVLISQDGEENDIFFIVSGSANVEANGRLVAVREAGTHVGEMALIDSKARRCATVRAAETTVVSRVTQREFTRIAAANPELWRRIAVELCDRLRNRNRQIRWPNEIPNVFIGSSSENLSVAEQIQLGLNHHRSVVRVWTDQVFGPMKYTMEDLEREVTAADFAIAVVTNDDVVRSRKKQLAAPRDNVVLELGLFMGQLGRKRTIIVLPRGIKLKLPSDLFGLNPLTYVPPKDPADKRQLAAAIAPVCTQLKMAIDEQGCR